MTIIRHTDPETGEEQGCPPCHWLIEPSGGPNSLGTCKFCGATRSFPNSLVERTRQQGMKAHKEQQSMAEGKEVWNREKRRL